MTGSNSPAWSGVLLGGWAAPTRSRPHHAVNGIVHRPGRTAIPPASRGLTRSASEYSA